MLAHVDKFVMLIIHSKMTTGIQATYYPVSVCPIIRIDMACGRNKIGYLVILTVITWQFLLSGLSTSPTLWK